MTHKLENPMKAVLAFSENVLEHGRDRFSKKNTPLFMDGINVDTFDSIPLTQFSGGRRGPLPPRKYISNLSEQQNLFRGLCGLSGLTGDSRYKDAATAAIRYHFDNLQYENGLLALGGHSYIDLLTLERDGDKGRDLELKTSTLFYELMFEVDSVATRRFIKGVWHSVVYDWNTLDFTRHGDFSIQSNRQWPDIPFSPPEPFFIGEGLTFIATGADLIHGALRLRHHTGDELASTWAKRLTTLYMNTRDENTGLFGSRISRRDPDRAFLQFGEDFGMRALEGKMIVDTPRTEGPNTLHGEGGYDTYANAFFTFLKSAETLGDEGDYLVDYVVDGLKAYAKYVYLPDENRFKPALTDGTDLTGYVVKKDGYYGKTGDVFQHSPVISTHLLTFTTASLASDDAELWDTARNMADALGMGDIGVEPGKSLDLNMVTDSSDPKQVFILLQLYKKTLAGDYLMMAKQVCENIAQSKFHKGFFLMKKDYVNASFNVIEPLAILATEAILRDKPEMVPEYEGGGDYVWSILCIKTGITFPGGKVTDAPYS